MLIILLTVIPAILAANTTPTKTYVAFQHSMYVVFNETGLFKFTRGELSWPSFITYLQDLDKKSDINVVVGFGNGSTVPVTYHTIILNRKNLCDILDSSVNKKEFATHFSVPEMLGLFGTRCPILKGKRNLTPYSFPSFTKLNDIGEGESDLIISIYMKNDKSALITLVCSMELRYWDSDARSIKTKITRSASIVTFPSTNLNIFSALFIFFLVK